MFFAKRNLVVLAALGILCIASPTFGDMFFLGLGDLPGAEFFSQAWAVSSDGSVAVGHSRYTGPPAIWKEAFAWTETDRIMMGLGHNPYPWVTTFAKGASADGSVIVGASWGEGGDAAFIWDFENGMRDLKQVLLQEYGLGVGDWQLAYATGISADGQTMVGWGRNPSGNTEGWIAHIPEPPALCLLALGALPLVRRKRRHILRFPSVSEVGREAALKRQNAPSSAVRSPTKPTGLTGASLFARRPGAPAALALMVAISWPSGALRGEGIYDLYGSNNDAVSGDLSLFGIEPSTGSAHLVGAFGPQVNYYMDGLAPADPRGALYGSSVGTVSGYPSLFTIDTDTGWATLVGEFGSQVNWYMEGLAFDPWSETLYGSSVKSFTGEPGLFTIDTDTALASFIGPFGSEWTMAVGEGGWGLAFDPWTETLYATGVRTGGYPALFTIDTDTGRADLVGEFGSAVYWYMEGLAFDPWSETLYGSSFSSPYGWGQSLFRIDPWSGEATLVGDFGSEVLWHMEGLAHITIPEPATLWLLALGALLPMVRRNRVA